MKRDDSSPAAYIKSIDSDLKDVLKVIRDLIFELRPDIQEIIQYGMLGYPGLGNLAAQKHYVSLYVSPKALAEHKKQHPSADCGKSCLRFRSMKHVNKADVTDLLTSVLKSA